ncbi:MAG: bifunctional UDP-N-acetylmuramoyl-tripeptide:D-alanyl-D-alanine ligase/alanine racemase, partial [Leptolyngbya sp. SIO3F4]|nr:bifunctional UDP-N-acetylmuramoyl-tripeptide:D-alanyl-D-alanine ligase/alanine racemase [Leptolyngbya sp. SIO3F4]
MTELLSKDNLEKLATKQFLLTDSRKLLNPAASVFFAIKGLKHDGHQYIKELYHQGVKHFVVEESPKEKYEDAIFYKVENSIKALQELATYHRKKFNYPVIGITGSNGKTIVKEWIYQLLSPDQSIIKSPGSYNSQIGVPLSVWGMAAHHQLGVFEAGISKTYEMQHLQPIIQPTIGILTNIGSAHDEGFPNRSVKLTEKLNLFSNCECLIYPLDANIQNHVLQKYPCRKISWAFGKNADVCLDIRAVFPHATEVDCTYEGQSFSLALPFADSASLENVATCVALLLYLKVPVEVIAQRVENLR